MCGCVGACIRMTCEWVYVCGKEQHWEILGLNTLSPFAFCRFVVLVNTSGVRTIRCSWCCRRWQGFLFFVTSLLVHQGNVWVWYREEYIAARVTLK